MFQNLIVVGDSNYEIDAGIALCAIIEKCVLKTVKLTEAPNVSELLK